MGRAPCCTKVGLRRGPWTAREDELLTSYVQLHGEGNWKSMSKKAGLLRCGKSCRLRWMNYLRPDIKRGNITPEEDDLIIKLHSLLGNRWALIAGRLPGRTDNEIKNYWNTHVKKKLILQGLDRFTHKKLLNPCVVKKESKNRRNNNTSNDGNKRQTKSCETPILEPPEKLKVHNPKPTRIKSLSSFPLSRNISFDWTTASSSSGIEGEKGLFMWSNLMEHRDHDHDFVQGLDLKCQSHMDDHSLEKLYDEYFHLLKLEDEQNQLDSFAESLLM